MTKTLKACLVTLAIVLLPMSASAQSAVLLREEFNDLARWCPVTFPKIQEHTQYTIEYQGRESVLRAESRASASAIVYREPVSVYDYQHVSVVFLPLIQGSPNRCSVAPVPVVAVHNCSSRGGNLAAAIR